jgi:hypothetical protein
MERGQSKIPSILCYHQSPFSGTVVNVDALQYSTVPIFVIMLQGQSLGPGEGGLINPIQALGNTGRSGLGWS